MNTFQIDLREWRAQAVSMGEDDFTVELTDGRTLRVVAIWMKEHETGQTKFITMYPA